MYAVDDKILLLTNLYFVKTYMIDNHLYESEPKLIFDDTW